MQEIILEDHSHPLADYNPDPKKLAGFSRQRPNQTRTQVLPSQEGRRGHSQFSTSGLVLEHEHVGASAGNHNATTFLNNLYFWNVKDFV